MTSPSLLSLQADSHRVEEAGGISVPAFSGVVDPPRRFVDGVLNGALQEGRFAMT
jgi:hypothetical protein